MFILRDSLQTESSWLFFHIILLAGFVRKYYIITSLIAFVLNCIYMIATSTSVTATLVSVLFSSALLIAVTNLLYQSSDDTVQSSIHIPLMKDDSFFGHIGLLHYPYKHERALHYTHILGPVLQFIYFGRTIGSLYILKYIICILIVLIRLLS